MLTNERVGLLGKIIGRWWKHFGELWGVASDIKNKTFVLIRAFTHPELFAVFGTPCHNPLP
jgi:hypothetical protein